MEFCSILCGSLDGRGVWGRMDACICMAGSLCCSPKTITTLLIGYNPIQNKKLKKKKRWALTGSLRRRYWDKNSYTNDLLRECSPNKPIMKWGM